jgi:hypothetical protein
LRCWAILPAAPPSSRFLLLLPLLGRRPRPSSSIAPSSLSSASSSAGSSSTASSRHTINSHLLRLDAAGIALKSGRHLDADIVVTATGLNLLALGGVRISVDGTEVKPQDRFSYKAHMLEDVPNLIWCIGYTNASWTLRADMTARSTARLMEYMKAHGYTHAYPHPGGAPMPEKPPGDLQAGYVLRNPPALPKTGKKRPWVVRQDYFADAFDHRFRDSIEEDMVFGKVTSPAQLVG